MRKQQKYRNNWWKKNCVNSNPCVFGLGSQGLLCFETRSHTKGLMLQICRMLQDTAWFVQNMFHWRVRKCSTTPTPEASKNYNYREKIRKVPNDKKDPLLWPKKNWIVLPANLPALLFFAVPWNQKPHQRCGCPVGLPCKSAGYCRICSKHILSLAVTCPPSKEECQFKKYFAAKFISGSVKIGMESTGHSDLVDWKTIVDNTGGSVTIIASCCNNEGRKDDQIVLPNHRRFYLMPSSHSNCQQVGLRFFPESCKLNGKLPCRLFHCLLGSADILAFCTLCPCWFGKSTCAINCQLSNLVCCCMDNH